MTQESKKIRKGDNVRMANVPGTVKVIEMSADENWARVRGTDGDPGWRHTSILTVVPRVRKSRAKVTDAAKTASVDTTAE